SPVGEVFVAVSRDGICRVSYGVTEAAWVRELEDTFGRATRTEQGSLEEALGQLVGYFEGSRRDFALPLDLSRQSSFQRRILRVVEQIPWGNVLSYGEVAEEAGLRGAARAVGGVM